jgi:pimeloyl-ACP methyl ester carboxylesterase
MAASGVHPKQVHELHSFEDYFEPLMEFMESLPPEERVVLVGHSMSGICISVAMERFPEKISAAVFAAAVMPGPDLSFKAISEKVLFALPPPPLQRNSKSILCSCLIV